MRLLWTYLIGPVLAFFPRRLRLALGSGEVRWQSAGMLSGLLESAGGIAELKDIGICTGCKKW